MSEVKSGLVHFVFLANIRGKHSRRLFLADPDWFFWAIEESVFIGEDGAEARPEN
jgi:hypothetical protein